MTEVDNAIFYSLTLFFLKSAIFAAIMEKFVDVILPLPCIAALRILFRKRWREMYRLVAG